MLKWETCIWKYLWGGVKKKQENYVHTVSVPPGQNVVLDPGPIQMFNKLPKYHYLPASETPMNSREIDDFQPRVQLPKLFQAGQISSDSADVVDRFCQKYIVEICDMCIFSILSFWP